MTAPATAAAREAARIAQVGYTAVIDRMTPALDHATVAANVARSVGSAGGAPTSSEVIADAWSPSWPIGAVTLFEADRTSGEFGTDGTFPFGITVAADGALGALAATAILHEPSAQLRAVAAATSDAVAAVIAGIRPGVSIDVLAAILAVETAQVGVPVALIALTLAGGDVLPPAPGAVIVEGDVLAVGAIARSAEGPIVFQTTVHVSTEGAERLEAFPLRLIELR